MQAHNLSRLVSVCWEGGRGRDGEGGVCVCAGVDGCCCVAACMATLHAWPAMLSPAMPLHCCCSFINRDDLDFAAIADMPPVQVGGTDSKRSDLAWPGQSFDPLKH